MHSITPMVQPHKMRIKKPSHFMQSPYDGMLQVTAEQDEVYEKILLSSTKQRSSKSSIKKYVSVQLIFFLYIVCHFLLLV
jgi:hypothetical protein